MCLGGSRLEIAGSEACLRRRCAREYDAGGGHYGIGGARADAVCCPLPVADRSTRLRTAAKTHKSNGGV